MFDERMTCDACSSGYPIVAVAHPDHQERIFDLRVHRPAYCVPPGVDSWADTQQWYEKYHHKYAALDDLEIYRVELDSVKEIYTDEFQLQGSVLDVGGHQGRLRAYLNADVTQYVDVDPFLECFQGLESQSNLLSVFPSLREATNFLSCQAEYLPFAADSFDWVHMRSVLDHFYDPYVALREAYRVLKPGGHLMIGVSLHEDHHKTPETEPGADAVVSPEGPIVQSQPSLRARVSSKIQRDGLGGLAKAVVSRLTHGQEVSVPVQVENASAEAEPVDPVDEDRHLYHWTYENLLDLVKQTGFTLTKEHWQKPPYSFVIYLTARKKL
jgi:SAM-dependent methyltransferase